MRNSPGLGNVLGDRRDASLVLELDDSTVKANHVMSISREGGEYDWVELHSMSATLTCETELCISRA